VRALLLVSSACGIPVQCRVWHRANSPAVAKSWRLNSRDALSICASQSTLHAEIGAVKEGRRVCHNQRLCRRLVLVAGI
jgi:hypothetical protein